MRAWWSQYGLVVIAGIVIAVGGLFGFNFYQDRQAENDLASSDLFESLAGHVMAGDLDSAEAVADELANEYGGTAYAPHAKLALARLYMDKNRDQDAADTLAELLEMNGHDKLKHIGRLRLASVLLYQDKPQEAVDLLEGEEAAAFTPLYDEMLGDAYTELEEYGKARDAYARAMADPSSEPVVNRNLVQMKLADLPAAAASEDGATE